MRHDLDPAELTPDERLQEVAGILATGVLRLHDRTALPVTSSPNPTSGNLAETAPETLAVPAESSVTVTGG
jgi:hypothetical protein